MGSVDGSPLLYRASENGTAHPRRECGVPDRATGARRPARGYQNSRDGRHRVQRRLAVLCQRWRETTTRPGSLELDECKRQSSRRVVPYRETCSQMRSDLGSSRRKGHHTLPKKPARITPGWGNRAARRAGLKPAPLLTHRPRLLRRCNALGQCCVHDTPSGPADPRKTGTTYGPRLAPRVVWRAHPVNAPPACEGGLRARWFAVERMTVGGPAHG